MKAPDKIYVREYPVGLNQEWDEKPRVRTVAIAQHEYIRKDALMELLTPEHDVAYCEDYERGCIDGRNALREELINKMNSM